MADIIQKENPTLRKVAVPVTKESFDSPALDRIIKDMTAALDKELDGVALAAPQIGISQRIFIVRNDRLVSHPDGVIPVPEVGIYINPQFIRTSRRRRILDEGCLSVRGTYGKTQRFERATVKAQNIDGTWFERGGGGLLAQIFQHEIDHLNGILFIDHAEELVDVPTKKVEANDTN